MVKASRHTLIANIIQQFCAGLLLLFLPNILDKADYAQIVYVTTLLSFAAFADLGISLAYGRNVPALLANNDHEKITLWNRTTLNFGLLTSALYSVVISAIYYFQYQNFSNALLLLPVPFLIFWFSFHVGRVSASGEFRAYRKAITWRSITSLIIFPLVYTLSLTGWFISQLIAAAFALFSIGKPLLTPLSKPHWPLLRSHIREGIMLSSISVLWLQLLNFARLYASASYTPEDLATYGIISAAYQSFSTLIISLFLPVTVGIMSRYGKDPEEALTFAHSITRRSLPLSILSVAAALICAPIVLHFCFPSYYFDNTILISTLLGITFHAFFIVWGNLLVAQGKFLKYLSLIIISLLISIASAYAIDQFAIPNGAAWGQFSGIIFYTFILFIAVSDFSDHNKKTAWKKQSLYLSTAYLFCAIVIYIYAFLGLL